MAIAILEHIMLMKLVDDFTSNGYMNDENQGGVLIGNKHAARTGLEPATTRMSDTLWLGALPTELTDSV